MDRRAQDPTKRKACRSPGGHTTIAKKPRASPALPTPPPPAATQPVPILATGGVRNHKRMAPTNATPAIQTSQGPVHHALFVPDPLPAGSAMAAGAADTRRSGSEPRAKKAKTSGASVPTAGTGKGRRSQAPAQARPRASTPSTQRSRATTPTRPSTSGAVSGGVSGSPGQVKATTQGGVDAKVLKLLCKALQEEMAKAGEERREVLQKAASFLAAKVSEQVMMPRMS